MIKLPYKNTQKRSSSTMVYSTSNIFSLQSLLFDTEDFSSCFFRKPSERELEFLSLYVTVQQLLSFL